MGLRRPIVVFVFLAGSLAASAVLYGAYFSGSNTAFTFDVPGTNAVEPAVAISPRGDLAVAWVNEGSALALLQDPLEGPGLYLRSARATNWTLDRATRRIAGTEARTPELAMAADGSMVAVWIEVDGGGVGTIRAQRFDPLLVPRGGAFTVAAETGDDQRGPAVAMDLAGDFVIAWQSGAPGARSVRVQQFEADGTIAGAEFSPHAATSGDRIDPSLAMGPDGWWAVAWEDDDGDGRGAMMRSFDADGVARGGVVVLNETTAGAQLDPAIAATADGRLIAVWTGNGLPATADADDDGVFARWFGSDGVALAGEWRANSYAGSPTSEAVVTADADGDVAIGWITYSGGFSPEHMATMRRFAKDGAAREAEPNIDATTGDESGIDLVMDADGDLLMAWSHDYWRGDYAVTTLYSNFEDIDLGVDLAAPSTAMAGTQGNVTVTVTNHASPPLTSTGFNEIDSALRATPDVTLELSTSGQITLAPTSTWPVGLCHSGDPCVQLGVMRPGEVRVIQVPAGFATSYKIWGQARVSAYAAIPSYDPVSNNGASRFVEITPAPADVRAIAPAAPTFKLKKKAQFGLLMRSETVGENVPLRNLRMTMTMPKNLKIVGFVGSMFPNPCSFSTTSASCTFASASSGFAMEVRVEALKKGSGAVTVSVSADNPDANAANNRAQVTIKVK